MKVSEFLAHADLPVLFGLLDQGSTNQDCTRLAVVLAWVTKIVQMECITCDRAGAANSRAAARGHGV